MVDFRRLFPVFAIAALTVGAGVANAQTPGVTPFTCTATTGSPNTVRAEGLTELLGDLLLNCTGGIPTALNQTVPQYNIDIRLNTNITSKILNTTTNSSEALLLIDEPRFESGNQRGCNSSSVQGCTLLGVNTGGTTTSINYNIPTAASNNPAGLATPNIVRNIYASRYLNPTVNPNVVSFTGVPIDPPGSSTRTIRITNLRANASQLGASSSLIPSQVVAFISISGGAGLPVQNNQVVLGYVVPGLVADTAPAFGAIARNAANGAALASTGTSFLQCLSAINQPGPLIPIADVIRFQERFPTAFRRRSTGPVGTITGGAGPATTQTVTAGFENSTTPQPFFDRQFNTETGFYNPALPTGGTGDTNDAGITAAGLADTGTRFFVRFTNIPAGVTLYASLYEVTVVGGVTVPNSQSRVRLITTDASGAGAYTATAGTTGLTGQPTPAIGVLNVSGTTATAVYEVIGADPLNIDTIDVAIFANFTAATATNSPALGTVSVSAGFAPVSTIAVPSNATVPRFVDNGLVRPGFVINTCQTNLLFPFVTNAFGYDTGIAISNTTLDVNSVNLSAQQGACTLYYYGTTLPGGGAAPASFTSAAVPAGSQLVFTLGGGGNVTGVTTTPVPATPGFQGYMIARCAFQGAHGFAFITSPNNVAAEGYLALVLDNPSISRYNTNSESLGQ